MEWKYRGAKGKMSPDRYFNGKWTINLGDDIKGCAPALKSVAVWDDRGVLEIYVKMAEEVPCEPVKSAELIRKRFKDEYGASKAIADVADGKFRVNRYRYRVAIYLSLKERPDAEKVMKCREMIRECLVEPEFIGETKDGEVQCVYAYTELPYDNYYRCMIRLRAYERAQGKKKKMLKGLYWRLAV